MIIRMNKKIKTFFAAGTVVVLATACGAPKYESTDLTVREVIANNEDETYMDEINKEDSTLADKVDCLEAYMDLEETLDTLDLGEAETMNEISEDQKEKLDELDMDYIQSLIEVYAQQEAGFKEKVESKVAIQRLAYVKQVVGEWVDKNSYQIVDDLLIQVVKSSAAMASGFEPTDYSNFEITRQPLKRDSDQTLYLTYTEFETGSIVPIKVKSSEKNIIYRAIKTTYGIETDPETNTREDYKKALNIAKFCIASGAVIEEKGLTEKLDSKNVAVNLSKSMSNK